MPEIFELFSDYKSCSLYVVGLCLHFQMLSSYCRLQCGRTVAVWDDWLYMEAQIACTKSDVCDRWLSCSSRYMIVTLSERPDATTDVLKAPTFTAFDIISITYLHWSLSGSGLRRIIPGTKMLWCFARLFTNVGFDGQDFVGTLHVDL